MNIKYLTKAQLTKCATYAKETGATPSITVDYAESLSPFYRYPIEVVLFQREEKNETVVMLVVSSPGETVAQVIPDNVFNELDSMPVKEA